MRSSKMDARGLPLVVLPWIELGRLRERERWQATGIALLEQAVRKEIGALMREASSLIPTPTLDTHPSARLRPAPPARQESIDLKQLLTTQLKASDTNIASIFSQFKQFFPPMKIEVP
ncbi:hypothetical protein GOP47_0006378 [Adiantum capillus-veneris]|uniref:Uncharacterized protein n=1 Tax=Adiantum capillus-veneris TaxID=13818 RepID=A0A9D4V3K4_ADICA|nr:hypothetical protein GOP47_0006378 [Adiantum capillus-veneris]